jgi:hypothetical protein
MVSIKDPNCDLNLVVTVSAFKKLLRLAFFVVSGSSAKILWSRTFDVESMSCFNSEGMASLFLSIKPIVLY